MTIFLINPNSSVGMTDGMLEAARATIPSADFAGITSHDGPAAIQGAEDGARAVPPLLLCIERAEALGARAIIIGCFDDTGLAEARFRASCPVIGIGEASCCAAAALGGRFSVVTTLQVSVPVIEANIARYGLDGRLGRVRASGVPVLDLERDAEASAAKVISEMRRAADADGIGAIVAGCAGMVDIPRLAAECLEVPVIDGVRAAASLAALCREHDGPPRALR